ncbi:MAG: hypothetical protein OEL55_05995, partial [Desulfobulbaceae bacterium]|nr:hypothetical protein [Desulfobulbaceae bacterium]
MATNDTGSAGGPLGVVDRVRPVAEGHFKADVLVLVACMRVVAGDTSSPLFHVDVKVMQIVFAIPEIGQGGGEFLFRDILVVASEAEIIFTCFIFTVEIPWEITDQQFRKFGAMYL